MRTVMIIIAAVCALTLLISYWLAAMVVTGKRQSLGEAFQWQSEHYDTSFYEDLEKTDYTAAGHEGYVLHTELLKNPEPTDKYMILSHGYTDNRYGSLKYVKMYLDLGFNCIIYDLRGHGENEKAITTYGVEEAKDLIKLVEDTRIRYPEISVLGLHGESLGAATTITSLRYQPDVDFAAADCGFSDIENVLRNVYASYHVPGFVLELTDLAMRLFYHYSLKTMRPADSLDGSRIPVLYIHGADDSFIDPKNSQDMFERTKGVREIHLIPGANHANSILTDPESYRKYVAGFLQKLSLIP